MIQINFLAPDQSNPIEMRAWIFVIPKDNKHTDPMNDGSTTIVQIFVVDDMQKETTDAGYQNF